MSKQVLWTVLVVGLAMLSLWNLSLMMGQSPTAQNPFTPLQNTYDIIKHRFYRADELNQAELVEGSLRGLMEQLNDPYSNYFTAEEFERFNRGLEGEFVGVGIYIGIRKNRLTVISPIKGSPADEAGARAGDVILFIDGVDTEGMTLDEAISRLRGVENTEVHIRVLHRDGSEESLVVVRGVIHVPTVETNLLDDGAVGYLRLFTFNENAGADVENALNEFQKAGVKGIILDLRGNGGGLLNQAIRISSQFVDSGLVLSTIGLEDQRTYNSQGNRWPNLPVAVLIDGGTASASEIVAGAIQDTQMGVLVGQQSFGKGVVQSLIPLESGAYLRLTTSEYLTPSGRHVQGNGLSPDLPVPDAGELIARGSDQLLSLKASLFTKTARKQVDALLTGLTDLMDQYQDDTLDADQAAVALLANLRQNKSALAAASDAANPTELLITLEQTLVELVDALAHSSLKTALAWLRTHAGQLCPCQATSAAKL